MITEKPNMNRKLKRISILYFDVKKRDITFAGMEKIFFDELFNTAPNVLCGHEKKIQNVQVRPLILGDGGYLLRNWLLKSFKFT